VPVAAAVLLGMLAVAEAVWVEVGRHGGLPGTATPTGLAILLVVLVLVHPGHDTPARFPVDEASRAALTMFAASVVSLAASRS